MENDTKSSQDFQTGPDNREKASYVEPPQTHASPVHVEKEPPNLHGSSPHIESHDVSSELHEHNASFGVEKADDNKSTTSGRPNPEIRPPGNGNPQIRHSYPENRDSFPEGRHNWNMQFEDAASAAKAAAESAERASMAARAAAELSNREKIIRQYSNGSHNSLSSDLKDEVSQEYAFYDDKHPSTDSVNRTFPSSDSLVNNEQIDVREQGKLMVESDQYYSSSNVNAVKQAPSTSLASSSSSAEYNPFRSGSQMADIHSCNNSLDQEKSDFLCEVNMEKMESRSEGGFVSELHDYMNTKDNDHYGDASMNEQSVNVSSSQHNTQFDSHDDVLELNRQKMGENAVADFYVTDEGNIQRNFKEATSYDDTAVRFDDSECGDDDYKFDLDTYDGQGSSLYFSSGSKPEIDPLANKSSSTPRQDIEDKGEMSSSQTHLPVFSESLTDLAYSPGREELLPVTFDDSDGPSSESQEDLIKSEVDGMKQRPNHGASGSTNDENVDIDRKLLLSPSVGLDTMQEHFEKKMSITSMSDNSFHYDDSLTGHSYSKGMSSALDLDVKENVQSSQSPDIFSNTETVEETHIESGKELNYGILKGGLRNKGYRRPHYIKNLSGKGSLPSRDVKVQKEQSSPIIWTSMNSDAHDQETYMREESKGNRSLGLRAHDASSDSSTYDTVANTQETLATQGPPINEVVNEVNKKSSSRSSVSYFDSDSSDSEDMLPKQSSARRTRPVGGFSQRTTAPSKAATNSIPTATRLPKASVTPGTQLGRKSSSRVSRDGESQKIASSRTKSFDNWATSKHEPAKLAAAKSIPEANSNRSLPVEIISSSASIQPSSSLPKTVTPDSADDSKSLDSGRGTPSKQKTSHVHPKLPDYDSFAAHFQSLKKGR